MKSVKDLPPKYIRVGGQLYQRLPRTAAGTFEQENPEAALADPTTIELNDTQIQTLANAIMVAFAYAMVQGGIKTPADLQNYKEESLVAQIPKILQMISSKGQTYFNNAMRQLRAKGPEKFAKDAGRALQQV